MFKRKCYVLVEEKDSYKSKIVSCFILHKRKKRKIIVNASSFSVWYANSKPTVNISCVHHPFCYRTRSRHKEITLLINENSFSSMTYTQLSHLNQ